MPIFMNSLSGKVAGVQINSGATGAGGATRVVMRGMKSLTKDNNALYVIEVYLFFNTGKKRWRRIIWRDGRIRCCC